VSKPFYILLALGSLIGSDDAKTSDPSKKDLEKMQGTWHAIAGEVKGTPSDADALKKFELVVKNDSYTVKTGGKEHVSAKLVLRAGKEPKEMDIVLETDPVYKGREGNEVREQGRGAGMGQHEDELVTASMVGVPATGVSFRRANDLEFKATLGGQLCKRTKFVMR
jgi:uncharacterized protein (TIGR03067 family)